MLPGELTETVNNYLKAITTSGLADPFITRITDLLVEDLEVLNQAMLAIRINKLVDAVAEADAIRDDLYIGFKDMIEAHKRRKDPKMVEAYQILWPLIEQAGTRLYSLGYTEQSGKMEALFIELDKSENKKVMEDINVYEIYGELKQAQADFVAIYDSRLDEDSKKDYPTLRQAKSQLVPHVNILLDAVGLLDETDPGTHTDLVNKMNAITTEITATALARKTKSESEEEEYVEN